MKIEKVSIYEWFLKLPTIISLKEKTLCYSVQDETEVTYGKEEDCDIKWCQEHNIPTYNLDNIGGCIVHSQGNIGIGFIYCVYDYGSFMLTLLLNQLAEYLREKGIDAYVDKNDLMVNTYKAGSVAEYQYDPSTGWCYGILQISVNQDIEVIKHACKKPLVKVPIALSMYGITTQEMIDWVLEKAQEL